MQAEVNIGTAGHVDHGKTTLVRALTGEWTERHSEEIKRGITIKLGYADASFYKCGECGEYTMKPECTNKHKAEFLRKVSFVDCPGHENLMAVMLSGAAIMDGAILVIAANEECPQPQTAEHLAALETSGIKNIIIVQNKVDVVTKEDALKNYEQIKKFIAGTSIEKAPIIPVAAHYGTNIGPLIGAIQENIPTPVKDAKKVKMFVARSFDVNKPGTKMESLKGGVIGGAIISGILKTGDEIEISPGMEIRGKYVPIKTKVMSLFAGTEKIEEAKAGGLIAIGTSLDPSVTKSDRLVGNIVGLPGTLPQPTNKISMEVHLLERHLLQNVEKIKKGETLVINAGTAATSGIVTELYKNAINVTVKRPVCVEPKSKTAISRRVGNRWMLIGYGVIK